jgi:hypothetical protein
VRKEVSRRVVLGGILGIGVHAALSGDRNPYRGLQQHHPYRQNPELLAVSDRPVQILVEPSERIFDPATTMLSSKDIPLPSPVLTPRMQQRGYQEFLQQGGSLFYEAALVPDTLADPILEAVRPLDALQPSDTTRGIRFFPTKEAPNGEQLLVNGTPDETSNQIFLLLKPDTPVPTQVLKQTAFHEKVHLIENSVQISDAYFDQYTQLLADGKNLFDAYKLRLEQQGLSQSDISRELSRIGVSFDNLPPLKALGPLANVLTESSYAIGDSPNAGHPLGTVYELFASTITVAYYYPKSLAATIDALPRTEDQDLIRGVVRKSLAMVREYADDPEQANALFSSEIHTI